MKDSQRLRLRFVEQADELVATFGRHAPDPAACCRARFHPILFDSPAHYKRMAATPPFMYRLHGIRDGLVLRYPCRPKAQIHAIRRTTGNPARQPAWPRKPVAHRRHVDFVVPLRVASWRWSSVEPSYCSTLKAGTRNFWPLLKPGAVAGRNRRAPCRFAAGYPPARSATRDRDLGLIGPSPAKVARAHLGFSCDSGSSVTLTARMGAARARRFVLMGEMLTSAQAQQAGLVDEVVPDAELPGRGAEARTAARCRPDAGVRRDQAPLHARRLDAARVDAGR